MKLLQRCFSHAHPLGSSTCGYVKQEASKKQQRAEEGLVPFAQIDGFSNSTCENFDKMQMEFKVITESSGRASLWERTALKLLEMVI